MRLMPIVATTILLGLPATALADRAGDGPIRNPRVVSTYHVTSSLVGRAWEQTGKNGDYGRAVTDSKPGAPGCRDIFSVYAYGLQRRPVVHGHQVGPAGSRDTVHFDHSGKHATVSWWTGADSPKRNVAFGYQAAPASLRTGGTRYLAFRVTSELAGTSEACSPGRSASVVEVRTVARTMHVVAGPVKAVPPFGTP